MIRSSSTDNLRLLTCLNYFLIGWYNGYLDHYYIDSFKIYFSIVIVFQALGAVSLAVLRYVSSDTTFWQHILTLLPACCRSVPYRLIHRELDLAATSDDLPRRHFPPRVSSHCQPHVLDQHDLGRNSKGGDPHIVLRGGAENPAAVQIHLPVLLRHGVRHDSACGCGPAWCHGPSFLADSGLHCHLADGACGQLPLSFTVGAEPGTDAVHVLSTFFVTVHKFLSHEVHDFLGIITDTTYDGARKSG